MQLQPKVYLTVKDSVAKRVVRVGDSVFIIRPPAGVKLDDIAPFPAPFVVRLEQSISNKGKRWQVKVQYQTEDKRTHVDLFFPRHLRATKPMLSIGDQVVVTQAMAPVVVPVGTEGTVVGGDGCSYHITFLMHQYQPPVTVSQDGVPPDAVMLAAEVAGLPPSKLVEELSDDEGDMEGGGGDEPELEGGGGVDPEDRADEDGANTFTAPMHSQLYDALALQLQPHLLSSFCEYCAQRGVSAHDAAVTVQGHLVQFLRARPREDVFKPLPEEHVEALRAAGASEEQLRTLTADGVTASLTVNAAVARLKKLM